MQNNKIHKTVKGETSKYQNPKLLNCEILQYGKKKTHESLFIKNFH